MSFDQPYRLCRILPSPVFDQLGNVMQQMAQHLEVESLVLTEAVLPVGDRPYGRIERFVAVVSSQFSGLLVAESPLAGSPLAVEPTFPCPEEDPILSHALSADPADQRSQPVFYQVGLNFSQEAIALFLVELGSRLQPNSMALKTLQQANQQLQSNAPTLQSEFTLRLVEVLTGGFPAAAPDAFCDLRVEAALRRQVEQERSLNQVTTQIRRSIELPVVLQTAVQEAQKLLQADRVVIYEFDRATSLGANGRVSYESMATNASPSVLNLREEAYCFSEGADYRVKYHKGAILAVDDVELTYPLSPCLLKLLRREKVRAKLVVPVVVREELWGLLIVHQCWQPRHWESHEETFLKRIAEHLAIAIYQARLYSQLQQQKQMLEQRVAERTQELGDTLVAA